MAEKLTPAIEQAMMQLKVASFRIEDWFQLA